VCDAGSGVCAGHVGVAAQRVNVAIDVNVSVLNSKRNTANFAGVTLISPLVGRLPDWHKKTKPDGSYAGVSGPELVSVAKTNNSYNHHGYKTIVMDASVPLSPRHGANSTEWRGDQAIT